MTLLAVMLVPSGSALAQQKPAMPARPAPNSLYTRMGGYDVIAEIVNDFIMQLGQDKAFARFGGGRSHNSLVRTKQLVILQICYLAGGPCDYIGRDTKTAHAGLGITNAEWDSSIQKFKNSLNKFKVKEREQKDFIAMIQKLKPDIVEKPKDYQPTTAAPKGR
jgi:hemoglobin